MRAINPTSSRARARRTVVSMLAALAMAVSVVGGPVSAATPNWTMDDVVLLPASVTPGQAAGYEVTIRNGGPSNVSQLFLIAYLGDTQTAAPNPVYSATTGGTCPNTGGTLYCKLGQLKSGKSVTVTAAFTTPTDAATFSIRFEINTTGATTSDGGSSHGDTIQKTGTTSLTNDPDFAGSFVLSTTPVANAQGLSSANPQSTKVNPPTPNIPVTVADGAGVTPVNCTIACFSQTSEIHVGRGAIFNGLFKVEIGIHKDLSQTVNGIYHEFDQGHTPTAETITAKCPKNGNPNAPCFTVANTGGGHILITVYLRENGKIGAF